jgi:TrkA-C domain
MSETELSMPRPNGGPDHRPASLPTAAASLRQRLGGFRQVQPVDPLDYGQLPVVDRADRTHVVGLLSRSGVVRAYNEAMLAHLEAQEGQPMPLERLRGTELVEVRVARGSGLAGLLLRDLTLPDDTLVVTIARGRETVIPRGDTRLLASDRLLILVRSDAVDELRAHLVPMQDATASRKARERASL